MSGLAKKLALPTIFLIVDVINIALTISDHNRGRR